MGQETLSAHLELAATILIPFLLAYLDMRRRQRKNLDETIEKQGDLFAEMEQRQNARHTENRERLVAIETKLDPMWRDYLNGGNHR